MEHYQEIREKEESRAREIREKVLPLHGLVDRIAMIIIEDLRTFEIDGHKEKWTL